MPSGQNSSMACSNWLGFLPSHGLHLHQGVELLVVGQLMDVQQLVLEELVLAGGRQGLHHVNHLGDHLRRQGRQHVVEHLLVVCDPL
jgi:hypothetical protein